jgi:gliding motility-associated-like protein
MKNKTKKPFTYFNFTFLLCVFLSLINESNAQSSITNVKQFDLNGSEDAWNISQSLDGHIYVVGSLRRPSNIQGAFVFKADTCGNIVWSRVIPGPGTQIFRRVTSTADSGVIAVGVSATYPFPNFFTVIALKWDKNGNLEWSKALAINSPFGNWALGILQTSDGGYLINGNINSSGFQASAFALKLNAQGNAIWMKRYSFFEGINLRGAIEVDDGYVVSGDYLFNSNTTYRPYVVKLNKNNGDVITLKSYSFNGIVLSGGPIKRRPGGYIYNGLRSYNTTFTADCRHVMIYLNENFEAVKAIELVNTVNKGFCEPDILILPDGGFVSCFGGPRPNDDGDFYWVNPDGSLKWKTKFNSPFAQNLIGAANAGGNRYIFYGNTTLPNGQKDILWIKTSSDNQPEECGLTNSDLVSQDFPVTNVNFSYENVSNVPLSNWQSINPIIELDVHRNTFSCKENLIFTRDTTVCPNTDFQLEVKGVSNVKWFPENGISNPTSSNPIINVSNDTRFFISGTTLSGCTFFDSLDVNVTGPSNLSIQVDRKEICGPDSILASASGGVQYRWEPRNYSLMPDEASTKIWVPETLTISVEVTTEGGCKVRDSVEIVVNAKSELKLSPLFSTVCQGDSVNIIAEGGDAHYWGNAPPLFSGISGFKVSPQRDTIISVRIINTACKDTADFLSSITVNDIPTVIIKKSNDLDCDNLSAMLEASGGKEYRWFPITGLSNPNISTPTVSVRNSSRYYVAVSSEAGCEKIDSIDVKFDNFKPLILTPDTAVCNGIPFQLSASGAVSYSWIPATGLSNANIADPVANIDNEITYFVFGRNSEDCISRDSILIKVKPSPNPKIELDKNSICREDYIQLIASGGSIYAWSPSSLFSNPNVAATSAFISSTTELFVEIKNSEGCIARDSVRINFGSLSDFDVKVLNEFSCSGQAHEIVATGGNRYQWQPESLVSDPSAASVRTLISSDTTLSVKIWNDECLDSTFFAVPLKLYTKPNIEISKSGDLSCDVFSIQLFAKGGEKYRWFPAEGLNNPFIPDPIASPGKPMMYQIEVTDKNNCTYLDSIQIEFKPEGGTGLYQLPNAFTPNGDGLNDCFGITKWGPGIILDDFKIFNRWGNIVFVGSNANPCWNGQLKGIPLPSGTYVYKLAAKTPCGNVALSGVVLLLQ